MAASCHEPTTLARAPGSLGRRVVDGFLTRGTLSGNSAGHQQMGLYSVVLPPVPFATDVTEPRHIKTDGRNCVPRATKRDFPFVWSKSKAAGAGVAGPRLTGHAPGH